MHIDSFFACANSELDEAEFVIFGVPYDATQSFKPGSRFAPTAIREASWNLENYSLYFNFNLDFAKICDAGNVNVDVSFDRILRKHLKFKRIRYHSLLQADLSLQVFNFFNFFNSLGFGLYAIINVVLTPVSAKTFAGKSSPFSASKTIISTTFQDVPAGKYKEVSFTDLDLSPKIA